MVTEVFNIIHSRHPTQCHLSKEKKPMEINEFFIVNIVEMSPRNRLTNIYTCL